MTVPLLLGVEIGGTKLQLGLGRGDGRIIALERRRVDPGRGGEGIRAQIVEAASALLGRAGAEARDVAALGIGFGGPVDAERGVVTVSNQIDGWADFPIVAWARQALAVPRAALQNDADTAALGEAKFGAGLGFDPLIYVTVGSGIGGGLIVGGAIYRGSGRGAAEIGHLIVDDQAIRGGERSLVSLEQTASGWSIAENARHRLGYRGSDRLLELCENDMSRLTTEHIARAASEGDRMAESILDAACEAMGKALAHAVTLLAPRRIILGGGVSLIGPERWHEPIRREVELRVFPPFRGTFDVVPPSLGEEVVVHGALALALDACPQTAAADGPDRSLT